MPPPDAVCVEVGCTLDAVATRPVLTPWLTGVAVITDGDEWVCSIHDGRH